MSTYSPLVDLVMPLSLHSPICRAPAPPAILLCSKHLHDRHTYPHSTPWRPCLRPLNPHLYWCKIRSNIGNAIASDLYGVTQISNIYLNP
jgi:hypothetical protein